MPILESLSLIRDAPTYEILIVDDSEDIRTVLTMVLEQNGFDVVAAANVPGASNCIAAETFDVLLSGLHMPNSGDGLTVVSAMRHPHPKGGHTHLQRLSRNESCYCGDSFAGRRHPGQAAGRKLLVNTIR